MIRVAFTDVVFEDRAAIHLDGCEFAFFGPLHTADEIINAARDVDVLCMRDQFGRVTREVLEQLPKLKLIVTRSSGYDHIDLPEATRRNIPVCNVPDYGAHGIAEMAFGLLLSVARNIVRGDERYRREQRFSDDGLRGIELRGKTIGIIGTGRIGLHTIRIAKGFGMWVLGYDVIENRTAAQELGFQYALLEDVLGRSDVVSIHTQLNEATRHLINAERLAQMKRGAILINTSRGAVVDTNALRQALASGQLLGAGLDVLEDERTRHHDFSGLNVVITPHLGWYTDGVVSRIAAIALGNIESFVRGEIINRV